MPSSEPCYLHPRRDSALRCEVCQRPICNPCVQSSGTRLTCPACVSDAGRRRGAKTLGVATGAVGLLLAVGLWSWTGDAPDEPTPAARPSYGQALLEARRDPDDPEGWLRVAEALLEADKLAAAREPLERALAVAPDDPDVNARVGYYEYALGRDAEALARLERAQMLGADAPAVASTIAAIHDRLAAEADEQKAREDEVADERRAAALARARAERAAAEAIEARALEAETEAEARAEEHAAAAAEAQQRRFEAEACSLDVERRGSSFYVPASVNGRPLQLVFDTGATGLILSHEAAVRAGVPLDPGDTLLAQTANGAVRFLLAEVAELSIAGGVLRDVRAAVCQPGEQCLGAIDGLLGVRVQEALGMTLDAAGSRVRFADCE